MTFACEACGAALLPTAMKCLECGAGRAMVRCVQCLRAVDARANASVCEACGCEELRAVEEERAADDGTRAPLPCPRCSSRPSHVSGPATSVGYREEEATEGAEPMLLVPTTKGTVSECARCGGQFLGHTVMLALMVEALAIAAPSLQYRRPARDVSALSAGYLVCPGCRGLMNRKNFGDRSGVIVNVCRHDGTFLAAGDLPRILAFARAGGLREMQARMAQEKKQLALAAAAAAHSVAIEPTSVRPRAIDTDEWIMSMLTR